MRTTSVCVCLILAAVPRVWGRTIHVNPGSGGPLQAAIDGASDGDTLRIHAGTYNEAIDVTKRLRLIGDGADVVTVDAGCGAFTALNVGADGVTVRRLTVTRGTFYALDVENRDKVTIQETVTVAGCGSEEYGINLYQSTNVKLLRNETGGGFHDAGIYIGGIPSEARVRAIRNDSTGNQRGIIVEDSTDVPGGPPTVQVQANTVSGNGTGIFLHNSDGIRVYRNTVTGNANSGIELDGQSDENRIIGNDISGSTQDVADGGTGNCWKGNTYTTGSAPTTGCP
jgi:parallel beta-helix repeat protein